LHPLLVARDTHSGPKMTHHDGDGPPAKGHSEPRFGENCWVSVVHVVPAVMPVDTRPTGLGEWT
jgi:hypothetical protein